MMKTQFRKIPVMSRTLSKKQSRRKTPSKNALWGGRFNAAPSAVMQQINVSIHFDKRFAMQDIKGSRAHAKMLARQRIISAKDEAKIQKGLNAIEAEIGGGKFPFREEFEDIHLNIEARLQELIGDAAGRLHTARSRNDQAVTDFRLWVRDQIDDHFLPALDGLIRTLAQKAAEYSDTIMPGYTHFQAAQPVTFGHHLLAYCEMLSRDAARFSDCRARLNESPLGAAALAGTSFPIDRHFTAKQLGFDAPMRNSLDAVASRDFAIEFLSAMAILSSHLSRLSEELIIWCNDRFGFVQLPESMTTGSSIMPQKRNPDAAELVRGKTGRIFGSLQGLLVLIKGLPLAYNKDLQEDKPLVFDAADAAILSLQAMTAMIQGLQADRKKMLAAADSGFATATDLADYIVQELDIPFRKAHHIVGALVKLAEKKKIGLAGLTLSDLRSVEPRLDKDCLRVLDVKYSVSSRTSFGGTAPSNVKKAVAKITGRKIR